jgi:hypothetical protein
MRRQNHREFPVLDRDFPPQSVAQRRVFPRRNVGRILGRISRINTECCCPIQDGPSIWRCRRGPKRHLLRDSNTSEIGAKRKGWRTLKTWLLTPTQTCWRGKLTPGLLLSLLTSPADASTGRRLPMIAKSDEMSEAAPTARVFISYSRKDMAFADRLEAALKARGHVWSWPVSTFATVQHYVCN